jgi:hypothetical protein
VRTHLYRRVRAAVGGGEVQVAGEIRLDTAAMLAFQQVTQIEFVAASKPETLPLASSVPELVTKLVPVSMTSAPV